MVVITEGELDAASVYQVLRTWPVVSLPSGAAGAKKSIKKNLEWLQGYTKVVLLFDDDEAGRSAAKEAASVLSPGKVFIGFVEDAKMPRMRYRQMILKLLRELSGMQSLTDLMASSMASLY